VGLGDDMVA